MPIYEYKCQKCQAHFEKLIGGCGIEIPKVCPACGAKKIKRIFSTFSCLGEQKLKSSCRCSKSCSSCQ